MRPFLFNYKFLHIFFSAIFLTGCISEDVGEDTDGPTQAGFPEVTTRTVATSDEGTNVEAGGTIVTNGGSGITARGVCWSTEANPTINDGITTDGMGEGAFTSSVTGLEPNTRYYLRAYATNSLGTSYGDEVDFFTGKIIRQNIFLKSQEEVNSFGAQNYLTIIGNLAIGNIEQGSDITDLIPLNTLNQVRGELVIGGSARVGDGFIRLSNPFLETLDGLESIAFIGPFFLNDFDDKALEISNNASLKNINGLGGLGSFKGDLTIMNNPNLESLAGLEGLTEIDRLLVERNNALTNLNDLANLQDINRTIFISNNENLENLDILSRLSGSIGGFILASNPLITNLDFMSAVTRVSGNLGISNNPLLTNIDGLNGIQSVGGFLSIKETQLIAIDNLNELESVGQYVSIRDNVNLETINGLNGLETLSQYIEIKSNESLINVTGFNNLQTATGTSVTSLGGITITTAAVRITFNDNLELIDGFENLQEAKGDFYLGGAALIDISGFENLTTIERDFAMSLNPLLSDISGFRSIKTIGGLLRIQQHRQLQNLDFLSGLETVGERISIFLNTALSDFCGLQTLAQSGFLGEFYTSSNAFNPTLEEVANGNCSN